MGEGRGGGNGRGVGKGCTGCSVSDRHSIMLSNCGIKINKPAVCCIITFILSSLKDKKLYLADMVRMTKQAKYLT